MEQINVNCALRAARGEAWRETMRTFQTVGFEAVKTLLAVMKENSAPAAIRAQAASRILELGFKSRLEDLEERLAALEARQAEARADQ